jgi:hypothetical protein
MEAAMVEMSASEPRERLLAFVREVVRPLPHVRQRENALLYVRGLVEQGGRKSLQPTLFRLEETPARYESMQQFVADSPWDPELLVRACAERVAPEIGVLAWIVDDTGIVKDGKHSPGAKRQYSFGGSPRKASRTRRLMRRRNGSGDSEVMRATGFAVCGAVLAAGEAAFCPVREARGP